MHFESARVRKFSAFTLIPLHIKGNDLFNVEAGPFTLLANFGASLNAAALGANTFSNEFCISIEENLVN